MTKTDDGRDTQKQSQLGRFLDSPWPVLAIGLGIAKLAGNHLDGLPGFLVEVVLAFAAYVLLCWLRKKVRNTGKPIQRTHDGREASRVVPASSTNPLGVDVWTILIPLVILWATLFARSHGWLGNNAPERTNWIVVLGLVFIAGIFRLWWRSRKSRGEESPSRRESDE